MRAFIYSTVIFCLLGVQAPQVQAESEDKSSIRSLAEKSENFLDDVFKERSLDEDGFIKYRIGGEIRHRFEYRDDFNFNDRSFEDDGFNLMRYRLNMDLKVGKYIHGFAQGQHSDSHASRKAHKSGLFQNDIDLHQLWVKLSSPIEEIPGYVKVGRQKLAYGDQRFVGSFEWSNVARVFDAVKVSVKPVDWFNIDAWYSQVVAVDRGRADTANHKDNFFGIYTTLTPVKDHLLDTFVFFRRSRGGRVFRGERAGNVGPLKEYTVGNRFKGKRCLSAGCEAGGFDYGFEWAFQGGTRAQERIQALALHALLGYTFYDIPWDPRISFEYNHGSGDSDPRDGKFETFDNLFPTNHIHYGYMDFFSLRNLENLKLGFDFKPHKKVKVISAFHWFFLDTTNGPWQNAGGGVVRAGSPGADSSVGQEFDLLVKWKATKHLSFLAGYSHFFTGPFVEDTGANSDADFFYLQTALKF